LPHQQSKFTRSRNTFYLIRVPKEEKHSLADQLKRSSRSVCANLTEASAKRRYSKNWTSKLTDCTAETAETQVWLDFALDCEYIRQKDYAEFLSLSEEVGKLLSYMMSNPKLFGAATSKRQSRLKARSASIFAQWENTSGC
jgi:four helix bundle protein